MSRYEDNISKDELLKLIFINSFNRNKELKAIISILNASYDSDNSIISINGDWGSGKTFLIKQLIALWEKESDETKTKEFEPKLVNEFRDKYIPFYYNAWENDYATDATQSLLISFSEYLESKRNIHTKYASRIKNVIDIVEGVKEVTSSFINLEDPETNRTIKQHALTVDKARKTREAISELINNNTNMDCKLLLIIDDLDRCNPKYAINVLEAIKHTFNNKNILFLVVTNFEELGNIISSYYGGKFDGYRYLDRIFDNQLTISSVDSGQYLQSKLNNPQWHIPLIVARHLNMTMREINRYASTLNIIENNVKVSFYSEKSGLESFVKHILIPLFIGYRISNPKIYIQLKNGSGAKFICNFYHTYEDEMRGYMKQNNDNNSISPIDKLISQYYNELFSDEYISSFNANDSFWDIINLVSPRINYAT